eukprot:SAG31_NODE_12793_length_916_cov_1.397797_1_plen_170_part_00
MRGVATCDPSGLVEGRQDAQLMPNMCRVAHVPPAGGWTRLCHQPALDGLGANRPRPWTPRPSRSLLHVGNAWVEIDKSQDGFTHPHKGLGGLSQPTRAFPGRFMIHVDPQQSLSATVRDACIEVGQNACCESSDDEIPSCGTMYTTAKLNETAIETVSLAELRLLRGEA